MGRAIVRDPQVFLFDEPLSNLDAQLRAQMRTEIKKLHQQLRTTTVYVTHDQIEAMTLADRVVVMKDGVIEQVGTPHDLYHAPKTRFVAGFIGAPAMNFVPCRLVRNGDGCSVHLSDGLSLAMPTDRLARYEAHTDRDLVLGLRPEHITEAKGDNAGNGGESNRGAALPVTLDVVEPLGRETMVYFTLAGTELCGRVSAETAARAGDSMTLSADMTHMHLIDPDTGAVL
jgi:multiple sugar transport system ATP-binding protein